MVMPGRSFSGTSEYRYGFNGKELDKETAGTTTYDYGFRIYNPALGKFLSVDPLTKSYPWNSTYAFAENDVIRSVDLDGLERVITTIFSDAGDGKPQMAIINIYKTFHVVTSGLGAMNKSDFNDVVFGKLAAKGNTTLNLKTLADNTSQAQEASPEDIASGNYYSAKILYHYSIVAKDNVTINGAMEEIHKDNAQGGLIYNQLTNDEITQVAASFAKEGIDPKLNNAHDDYYRFEYMARSASRALAGGEEKGARAAGSNEKVNGVPYNMITFSSNYKSIKTSNDLTFAEDILHESGHNDAAGNVHGKGSYEYNQTGTQSNVPGDVYPTKANTLEILNDPANRKNTITIQFDNSKLKK